MGQRDSLGIIFLFYAQLQPRLNQIYVEIFACCVGMLDTGVGGHVKSKSIFGIME